MKIQINENVLKYLRSENQDSITVNYERNSCCGPSKITPSVKTGAPDNASLYNMEESDGIKVFIRKGIESADESGIKISLVNMAIIKILIAGNIRDTVE